jgi:hypothetical protein
MSQTTRETLREPFPTSGQGRVLTSLRAAAEDQETDGWRKVQLDAGRPPEMSAHQFVGFLALLKISGFYRPIDGRSWGLVRGTQVPSAPRQVCHRGSQAA